MMRAVRIPLYLTLLAAALPAGASTFLAMSREELVAQADSVVQGRVVRVDSFWNKEGTAILTEAVLEVEDAVLGQAPRFVRLVTFGGEVGGYTIIAHGFPTFAEGERLLLFLEPEKDGAHRILGYRQGQYSLRLDARGRTVAVPTFEAGSVLRADGTPAPHPPTILVERLKSQIRETAGRVGRGR